MLEHLASRGEAGEMRQRLSARGKPGRAPAMRSLRKVNRRTLDRLWARLCAARPQAAASREVLAGPDAMRELEQYAGNIENCIGALRIPLGLIGPLRINGLHANGDVFVPLATTEAALVASFNRGAEIVSRSGGASAALLREGVLRAPAFVFRDIYEAGVFIKWAVDSAGAFKQAAESTTRHGKLISIEPVLDHDVVFLLCQYTTGDASGQNMVTIATDAICRLIEEKSPVKPLYSFIEGNFSGDKKASYLGMLAGRGRKASASVIIPREIIRKYLRTTPERMMAYARVANLGSLLSGQIGAQAHYANALAAFYIATGQDAACVAESSVGFTRMEEREEGIFVSVTLPNVLAGSVGGGTGLPCQSAALDILGMKGPGKAAALAETAAALCLCGEISIIGAISAGHFTRAHRKLARESAK
jgi:hydroxymethylglutaryl-CoA reductase (NADPH)